MQTNAKTSAFQTTRINVAKVSVLPKATYRFNAIPMKTLVVIYTEIEKINPKIHMEKPKMNSQSVSPETRAKLKASHLHRTWCYKVTTIKTQGTEVQADTQTQGWEQTCWTGSSGVWQCCKNPRWTRQVLVSSTSGVRKTECPHSKEWCCTLILHHLQKSIQNGLKTQVKDLEL